MSTSRSILSSTGCHIGASPRYQDSVRNLNRSLVISKRNINSCLLGKRLRSFNTGLREQIPRKTKMNIAVYCSAPAVPPPPSDSSPGSWKVWVVGMVASVILPFFMNKWGPLLKLKREVETVVDTVESVVEVIEKVAEKVEDVAEEVADHLPAGGKLKEAATLVENIARETAKDAHMVDEVIDKVEEVEKDLDSLIDPLAERAKDGPEVANAGH